MVPVLGDVVRALHHPAAARVDGRLMCAALRRAAVAGVRCRRARGIGRRRACACRPTRSCIAGGAWTGKVAEQLGVQLPVGPVRGQIVHLGVDDHDTGTWPIVQPVFGYYMVPWADARVAVGATVEEVGFATDVTAGGVHEVLRETLRVMPGLAQSTIREVRVGLRPVSVDDTPILGALPGVGERVRRDGPRRQRIASRSGVGRARRRLGVRKRPALDLRRSARNASPDRRFGGYRSSLSARSAMMFFCTSVGPAPIVV